MTHQLELPIEELIEPAYDVGLSIQERFEVFHAANPWIARALEALVADWLKRGRRKVGMKALVEIVRWQYGRSTEAPEFRINNTYVSRYARLLIDLHPEWDEVIQTRELRAA